MRSSPRSARSIQVTGVDIAVYSSTRALSQQLDPRCAVQRHGPAGQASVEGRERGCPPAAAPRPSQVKRVGKVHPRAEVVQGIEHGVAVFDGHMADAEQGPQHPLDVGTRQLVEAAHHPFELQQDGDCDKGRLGHCRHCRWALQKRLVIVRIIDEEAGEDVGVQRLHDSGSGLRDKSDAGSKSSNRRGLPRAGALTNPARSATAVSGTVRVIRSRTPSGSSDSSSLVPAPSPSFVLVGLLAGMINSVLAARHLATAGFDRQARSVFRELTEVADLLLAILADEGFLDHYLATPEAFDKAYAHWAESLRPAKVRRRVDKLAKQMGFGKDAATADLLASRWSLYEWRSKSAHSDYGALVVESVAGDLNGLRRSTRRSEKARLDPPAAGQAPADPVPRPASASQANGWVLWFIPGFPSDGQDWCMALGSER
jgi:hypothetical protein